MSEAALGKYGVKPLARIAAYSWSACEPEIMGIGPVVAVREALRKVGKTVEDMDIIEVNEVSFDSGWIIYPAYEYPGVCGTMVGSAEGAGAAHREDQHVWRCNRGGPPPSG